ncbi:MAG: amino acid adenylation domain-containing protein [Prochloraceae cyanobacterium]
MGELPLLSEAERHQLLVEWNDTATDYPQDRCIHQLFEEQVKKTPDGVAVVFEDEQLTYQQLNHRANQLAAYLQTLGVGPEVLVGICVERSLEMVVGLLGILKAGGAYLPLDPNYPQERLSFMLEDSGIEVLLTQRELLKFLPEQQKQVVCLDTDRLQIAQYSQDNLNLGVSSEHLAYVIYTSGSTGLPKGVEIRHKSVVNFLNSMSYLPGLTQEDTFLAVTTICFDIAALELYLPLTVGAKVIVASREIATDGERLLSELCKSKTTVMQATPATWQMLLTAGWSESLPLKVFCGGEALSAQLAARILETQSQLWNLYGPTEATIWSTTCQVKVSSTVSCSIGRPIANTQIYILDSQFQPVPIGVPGELYIGGDGLARSYLNRSELTSEKFIPNPFCNSKSDRLYKTGDLVRYLADGNIEFLGRIDNQVKVRGFRIELGEIEASLNTHSEVKQVVVIATEDPSGNKRLVAYVVSSDRSLSSNQLREFLVSKLPEYMIPNAFVSLETLPLTANGKVDRKALPTPDERDLTREYIAPRTPSEEIIANIFAEVLGQKKVGIYDNFFELGGHSLLATQVVSRLRATWEGEIPLRAIFSSPTVAQLEPKLVQLRTKKNQLNLPPIRSRNQSEELPITWGQERLWFLNQLEGSSATYNMPGAIKIEGDLDLNALELAISEIVRRHEILRTSFHSLNGKPIQVIDPKATIKINLVDLQQLEATERESFLHQQAEIEENTPFNLEIAPLIRCSLLQLSAREYVLFLTVHHIVSDGWSMGILSQEISSLYQAFSTGEPSPLPELAIQYADFALWQREWLSKEVIETQLKYWKKQLHNAPELLELPTDRPRPSVQTYRGGTQSLSLDTDLSEKLQALSRQTGSTLFMTLLAAFATLLSRYSSRADILIGSPIANRNRSEIESSIGLFVNTLVLRTDLSGNPSFLELLGRVRSVTLDAYDRQDVPFEKLVEELQPERSLSYNPLFQVLFNMVNWEETQLELPALKTEPFQTNKSLHSKFDLTLYAAENQEKIELKLVYNLDLFASERIVKMLEQLEYLLEQIVDKPEKYLADLSLVTPQCSQLISDPKQVLSEPKYQPISQLFREQAKLNSQEIAISQGSFIWTYEELSNKAETVAKIVRKGEVVAVSGAASLGLIASMLGVLLAGGILLTLDPNLPQQRKELMLREAKAKLLLSVGDTEIENIEIEEIRVDSLTGIPEVENLPNCNRKVDISAEDPAYIFFTSGTTGIPKGVLGINKGLSHFLDWQRNTFKVGIGDRVAQLTGLSFDVVLREVFLPLTSGGTLCLPEHRDKTIDVIKWLKQQKITVLHTVPSLGQFWLSNSGEKSLPDLRCVFFAGEPLPGTLVNQWRNILPSGEIVNLYGPTETTLAKCYYRIPEEVKPGTQPVGFPIPQTQALVLNTQNNLCGIGEVGEIVIRTPFGSLGYINASVEGQKRFKKNPFSDLENDLLYYTGDLGRYSIDGALEILGRGDTQVKIRGVRIELGEIESLLTNHPQVKQAVVVLREDIPGNKRLVAYVVSEESSLTPQQICEFLKQKLPEYMVPSAFVTLDTLPLTPNGKIDRFALPAVDRDLAREEEYVAPRSPKEEIIANIFASVLGVEKVGICDNFFELGGHSLLATQLVSRLQKSFEVEIPLRAVFEFPTVAQLEPRLIELSRKETGLSLPPIKPRTKREQSPLSWAQERLWFLNQLVGASATYNMPMAISINGNLNINALQQALSEIVHRHEILRTSFQTLKGKPIQVIDPKTTIKVNMVDLQQLEETERDNILQQLAQTEAITPFNLEVSPLIRFSLLHLDAREYVLLLTMHHIVSDGWSLGIFIEELSSLYRAFNAGERSPLAELPIQYADFALWQRKWLKGKIIERQLNYWKQQLEGIPELLQLPTDRPRPLVQTYRGATQSFSINTNLTKKLQNLSRKFGTTLFMTLKAAFTTLLYRYSSRSDILIGTAIANRNRTEIESLIGFFVNTLVLRTSFEENPSFEKLLAQVRQTTLKAYENQDVPFEQVVEALQPERSLSHAPLFQVMFVFQNAPMGEMELAGVNLKELKLERTIAKFDLTLSIRKTEEGLVGSWEYNTDLFDRATIERMVAHFENLLNAIVENPQLSVSQLPLLSQAEQHQLLVEWNDTAQEYPKDRCIHQLFEEQVEKTPDAVAVVFEGEQLTYQQLNHRANQLAAYLQTLGVGPEVLVGICVERSLEMVVGLLGILKAGGAYVPLDPNYPLERLSYMLEDSGVEVLLTQQSLLDCFPEQQAKLVCLDTDRLQIARSNQANLAVGVNGEHLAYVIYTSGSTGLPKGVEICHHSVVNFLNAMSDLPGLTQEDTFLAVTTICFDIAALELYLPLTVGAKVILASSEIATDGERLLSELSKSKTTVMQATPATWQMLLTAGWSNSLPLKVFCGGEALSAQLAARILETRSQLWNLYGPTEATIWSTTCQVNVSSTVSCSIGHPIANTQIYILDEQLQPVPIGVAGELYIGGDGLARGYLNRPELTREKFIANPFSNSRDRRLYKTGDLARYLADGKIEFLGRIDNQVKIRGFRIELGEIEAALNNHLEIKQAVVIAKEDISGNKHLVAYVVNRSLSTKQLRQFLLAKLPEYMVPSAFVSLENFPLTPNGKVDRKSLATVDRDFTKEGEYVAPRSPTQEIIANIFASVLEPEKVGIEDNFFELGGHSLLATQVISRLRQSFHIDIPLCAIFESPTVAKLEQVINSADVAEIEEIQPIQREGEHLPLSLAQERLWILDRLVGKSSTYNIPAAIRISGSLDIFTLEKAFSEIIRRHEVLRTRFNFVDGSPVQVISPPTNFKIATLDVLETEVEDLILEKIQTPFDLSKDNLIRASLFCLGDREYILVVVMHHIVADGWSLEVLIRELSQLYQDFSQGKPSTLPDLPIQYFDYAVWQRQWLDSTRLSVHINYWQQKLANVPSQLNLPLDRPRPEIMTFNGSRESIDLDLEIVKELKNLSLESGTTLYMTLLAALKVLLSYYSEQEDIVVGSPIANRNRAEIEPLIGFFVNVLVLRSHLGGNPSFSDVLERVKQTCLEAYNHQDLPFEQLISQLDLERDLSLPPLVQVAFAFQKMPAITLRDSNLNVSLLEIPSKTSKTDLSFAVLEKQDKLTLNLEYNTDLFNRETIIEILANFEKLLKNIVKNPQQNLREILLESGLSSKLLSTSSQTETIYQLSNLTSYQLLMWLGQQLNPKKPIYNNLFVSNITNAIDLEYFQKAFQTVIDASDALRTIITANNSIPQQKVIEEFPYLVECIDFSAAANPHEKAIEWSRDRASIPLDPEKRLFDCVLLKIAADKYIWHLCLSQITLDGFSLALIYEYTTKLYTAYVNRENETEFKLPQFKQYLDYERSFRNSPRYIKSKSYWEDKLADPLESISFYGRPSKTLTTEVKRISHELGIEKSQQIKELAQEKDPNIFNIFLAIFAVYLYKISNVRKLSIGIPLRNRRLKSFKKTIGAFMQAVPLIIDIEDKDTISSLVARIGKSTFEALRHGQYVITDSRLQTNIYDITFNYHVEGYSHPNFFDTHYAEIQHDWIHLGHGKENLSIQVRDFNCSGNYIIDFDFNCEIFDRQLQNLAIQHFLQVLDSFLENKQQLIDRINILSPAEKEKVLVNFNQSQTVKSTHSTIDKLFTEQVSKTPHNTAVVCEGNSLTYYELNAKANQLAHYLQSLAVNEKESTIGVCLEKSLDTVIAILAILKAGSTYLPLDPNYPAERLTYMLEDADVSLLLTKRSLLSSRVDLKTIYIEEKTEILAQQSRENPDNRITGDNLAYVIYTSGSTGKPKGVAIAHNSLVNAYLAWETAYKLRNNVKTHLQMASFSFDVFTGDLVRALCSGGKLVLCQKEYLLDSQKLYKLMVEEKIDCAEFVPVVARNLMVYLRQTKQDLSFMKLLAVGSDSWYIKEYQELKNLCGKDTRVINSYGVSEATIDSCYFEATEENNLNEQQLVPIGKPLSNTRIYILDDRLQPVAIGIAGQMYIGGIQLARGYLNQPNLTKERFIHTPWGRLYKTGDLARYLPDGNIEFLGRSDNQVKIRGMRVELGEIESILNSHPDIQQAIVTVRDERPIAYLVLEGTAKDKQQDIRNFLKLRLPEYAIPSAFVVLEAFPLTPNGKIDRSALPKPDRQSINHKEYIAPRNDLEKQLTQIWSETLNLEKIGVKDSFFDLGGHSLLAVRLIAQIEQKYRKKIPLASLFQNPTIAQLAKSIESDPIRSNSVLVPIKTTGNRSPLFCIHPIEGHVFCYRDLASHLEEYPVYGLQSVGLDEDCQPLSTIEEMASQYIEAIETVQKTGPYHLAGWSLGGVIAFEIARQLSDRGEKIANLSLIDSHAPSTLDFSAPRHQSEFLLEITEDLSRRLDLDVGISLGEIQAIPPQQQLKYLLERFEQLKILPPEQIEQLWQVYQSNLRAYSQYKPKQYSGIINLFRARENQKKPFALGWDKIAKVRTVIVPGNHYQIIQSTQLSQHIKNNLNIADSKSK